MLNYGSALWKQALIWGCIGFAREAYRLQSPQSRDAVSRHIQQQTYLQKITLWLTVSTVASARLQQQNLFLLTLSLRKSAWASARRSAWITYSWRFKSASQYELANFSLAKFVKFRAKVWSFFVRFLSPHSKISKPSKIVNGLHRLFVSGFEPRHLHQKSSSSAAGGRFWFWWGGWWETGKSSNPIQEKRFPRAW